MTALNEFERLESSGTWRETPDAQRVDVVVSIGDATLVISRNDVALTHWSLPAIERLNPGKRPALFRPGTDATEVLEIDDETMIQAVAKVHSAIAKRRPHPGRLRYSLFATGMLFVLALMVFWLPNAMIRYTVSVVPDAKRATIGQSLLDNIQRVSGRQCDSPLGQHALAAMRNRLMGPDSGRIVVLDSGVQQATHLPGNIILLNRSLVEDHENPEVAAGFVLVEIQRASDHDPLFSLLSNTGLVSTFKLLTTGDIPAQNLKTYAEDLLTQTPEAIEQDDILSRFKTAQVRVTPYAYAIDISGENTVGLIEADLVNDTNATQILADGEWISLQDICNE